MKRILVVTLLFLSSAAGAQDRHPAMEKAWWANVGSFLAENDLKASAAGTIISVDREFDFEKALGLDDSGNLFMAELGWQYTDNWSVALQYFRTKRDGNRTLDESFEWKGDTYDIGASIDTGTQLEITRVFFARRFRDSGPHSFRVGAGIHWLDISAEVSGQATLNDESTEFRQNVAAASLPVPNIGAWYRYSPNDRWMVNTRIDWLSASIDNYSGDIWNGSVGVNYRIWNNIGVGASYQYFEIGGDVSEPNWNGVIKMTLTGPFIYVSGFW